MKKLIILLMLGLFSAIPMSADAILLGTGQLNVQWSPPTGGGYYLDYDGAVVSSNFGHTTGLEEIFCVSHDNANKTETVDFYTITSDLNSLVAAGLYDKLARAAWIADNWTHYGAVSDTLKGEAQKAVWKITGVMDIVGSDGKDFEIYNDAIAHSNYVTNSWYYAHSPGGNTTSNYQDYLTPVPIPEPAAMLLLGSSIIGLAGFRRKKIFNK